MNPSNRSPCTEAATLHLMEAAGQAPTTARRSLRPPKSVVTLERVQARGVAEGQKAENVSLHEDVPLRVKARLTEEVRDGVMVTLVKADVAICDIINRNGRYYPRSCYEAANAAAGPDMEDGGLWALMDHPEWWEPVRGSMQKIATKWTGLTIEEGREIEWPVGSGTTRKVDMVVAEGEIVDTAVGSDIKGLLKSGIRVGISTNGYGSAVWKKASELDPNYYDPDALIPVVQDDYRYNSIDYVSDPSNIGGRARTEASEAFDPDDLDVPAPIRPQEGKMHAILKALCEKHGKTLEQVKKEHAPEYYMALEQIADQAAAASGTPTTPAQPATPGNAGPNAPRRRSPRPSLLRSPPRRTRRKTRRGAATARWKTPCWSSRARSRPWSASCVTVSVTAWWKRPCCAPTCPPWAPSAKGKGPWTWTPPSAPI
ncbi:hypothetical protein [Deinococcus multiflagellatus]|uniref:Uncharacterized protein n=1 Tax=Deinococcus multiflagellatus TaxID=1656887 RepID=A0ABW1ZRI8_9DEIO